MKLAFIMYKQLNFGGAERRLLRIYNEIGKSFCVDIYVRGGNREEFEYAIKKADVRIENISNIICSDNINTFFRLMSEDYETVHFFDGSRFDFFLTSARYIMRKRTICTIAYQNIAYGLIDKKKEKKIGKLLSRCDSVDVLFPAGKDYLKRISGNNNITVTPGTFTDLSIFAPLKKDKILVFCAARLEKDKNAELLIKAVSICADSLRKEGYRIIILGKDYEEDNIRKYILERSIDDIVEMPGYVKTSEILPKAYGFFTLDLIDNYPSQSWAEAVASGCFVIATNVGMTYLYCDNDFSIMVGNSPKNLSIAIQNYIKIPNEQKNELVLSARKYAEKHYALKNSVDYFTKIIHGI